MAKTKKKYTRNNLLQRFTKQKQRNVLAQPGPSELVIILDGLKPNYNIGKIFRSSEAFGIKRIHLVGIDVFDPAPAKGSFRSVPAVFDENFANAYTALRKEGYAFFILTPAAGKSLENTPLPEKCALVFGHEEFGFSFDPGDYKGLEAVKITQVGKVDSLNVSVAASIAMYEYSRQHPVASGG